ncbi:uncharacterized protein LOC143627677 [Bidens hawaiensis]|uniref:uncharacterized protein LOC143627677 n=1 Tax=Bidens hawaiensis TaxID=980011 RepID=UPI004049CD02
MFRQLKINLPFIEALQHMPKYAKFLKDLLKRKDRLGEVSSIPLKGDCSAVVLNRVPEKLLDTGVFTIPYLFSSDAMRHALADLGASINLMSYSLYEKLKLGELTPTRMSLSLADHLVKYPRGSNGLVDCNDLGEDNSCTNDSVCDELVEISGLPEIKEVKEISCESETGSEEKPAQLELKVLPSHLEYAYLDVGSNLPIIVSSKLTKEKSKLIDVLKLHKGAIAWRLSDIQGTSPAYCTRQILMEDEYKPVVKPQRCLNPNMKEVLKNEVLKLMDAGMIYPISDSSWVSLTQVVPKKGGMTVVMNEKNELIHSSTVTGWRIKDKKGAENVAADHLSRLEDPRREELREEEIGDTFPHKSIDFVAAKKQGILWFTNFSNYLAKNIVLEGMTTQQKRKFFRDVNRYVWDDPFLFKIGGDRILRRCVTKEEGWDILKHVHEGLTGGHHGAHATAQKVFDSGFYWPTVVKDAEEFVKFYDAC